MLSIPKVLAERYEVIRRVGSGGMADVYLARDTELGRQVALKILHAHYARDEGFIERFRREARSAAGLQNANIVPIYDWGRSDDYHFIVMEFVEGRSLKDAIAADAPIDPRRAASIAIAMLNALEYAHRAGLVHRDIKPGNILLAKGGDAKVADFGIAREASGNTLTQTGAILGTAYYLSPEQAQGQSVDARSDLYSVAVVLYEMVTARRPFEGDSPVAIAFKHVRDAPTPPSKYRSSLPQTIETIVLKGLAKRPIDRYQSAAQMRGDLEAFLAGKPVKRTIAPDVPADSTSVLTKVSGGIRRSPRQATRRPGWALTAFAALIIAGLALGAWSMVALLQQSVGATPVPNIVSRTPTEAAKVLRGAELEPDFQGNEYSENIPEGRVTRQRPDAKRSVAKGSAVKFWVSAGLPFVQIPDLRGKSEVEAVRLLQSLGLEVGEKREDFSEQPAGSVLDQNPRAGASVRKRTKIDLTVSKGQDLATVPDVIGQVSEDAITVLADAGFRVQRFEGASDVVERGRVFDQNPKGGTQSPKSTVIQIFVSVGPATFEMPDVRFQQEQDARSTLENLGLIVQVQRVPGQRGFVLDQDPQPGTVVRRGQVVTIRVGNS